MATRAASRLALLRPSRYRPRMMATRLLQLCPFRVILTGGRLPPPSEFTTSSGISNPRIGSGGSTVVRTITIDAPSSSESSIDTRKEYVVSPASNPVVGGPFLSAQLQHYEAQPIEDVGQVRLKGSRA